MNKKLLIFGTGEIAELAHFYFTQDTAWQVAGFICDDAYFKEEKFCSLPCVKFSEIARYSPGKYAVHVALSYRKLNQIREEKYRTFKNLGYELPSYISSKSTIWTNEIGDNCFILEDQTIQPNVKIANNVMLWSGNHIGHGSVIEDHVYIASHVVISGHCHIGERSFIGVNAAIKDFITIGKDCFIGMGGNVIRDCPDGSVYISSRGELLDKDSRQAIVLKKYFN
jgi:sugar O-acyltransferase (sialic acid O-acetyltransferase NeuD family)